MNKRPILLQVAMEIECIELIKKLDNLKKKIIDNYILYEGTINNYPIVILISKVGLIETSISLTLTIKQYNPLAIINYGIAGATTKKLHTGDIVVADKCLNINSYKTKFRKENTGINTYDWELLTFLSGEADRLIEYKTDNNLLNIFTNNPPKVRYKKGTIGSGDVWNQEIDRIIYLNNKYKILCEDMESIATYTISHKYNIPVISIKIISDNSLLKEEYNRNVSTYLQEYIYSYVKYLRQNL